MSEYLWYIFNFLVWPGFVFTAVVGLLAVWIDRKVTAKVQWRVGPPWWQPFADFLKLLGKESLIPQGVSRFSFLFPPILGLAAVTLVSTLIWLILIDPQKTFVGDLIVIIYLLTIPALAVILGGSASRNPLASLGASREMKLMLGYELSFILALVVPIVKAGTIQLGELLEFQAKNGLILGSWSGIIAFIVAIITMQAKLTQVPFDIPEAETEIMSGPYIEYSGVSLGIYKLTRAMMLFVMPMFLVVVFWGGILFLGWHTLWGILKYCTLLVLIILMKNTNPRLRVDQAMKYFWGTSSILATLAVILALLGV